MRFESLAAAVAFAGLPLFYSAPAWAASAADKAAVDKEIMATGKIDAVTVYRGQALVTRVVDGGQGAGLREIVVTDLPEQVLPASIYAEPGEGVEVRSVSYRVRPLAQDVREEVRKLDDNIRQVDDKIAANQKQTQEMAEQRKYLEKLANFTAPTSQVELSKGVLNAETLQKLTSFQFDAHGRIAQQELRLAVELRGLNESRELLQRQRSELADSSSRYAREAVVFLNVNPPGNAARFRIRYLVGEAGWTPSYNVRAAADHKQVTLEYVGAVQQMSGEDWRNVTMTLSTATPSLTAKAPDLTPLTITLVPRSGPMVKRDFEKARTEIAQQQVQAELSYNSAPNAPASGGGAQLFGSAGTGGGGKGEEAQKDQVTTLNDVAGQLQMLDLQLAAAGKPRRSRGVAEPTSDEGVSVTYDLPGRTTLPSRSDQQLIQIASMPVKAQFFKLATPVLTRYVYDEATLTNDSKMVLLAGPAATYAGGQFVGQGQVPTAAIGESFTVGFGIDSSLRAGRELVEKTETTQGGNMVMNFTYRLTLENFSDKPAAVRVFDRLPTAKQSEIKVTLGETRHDLSADPEYQQTASKKGILRWDLDVPAQAIGPKALVFDYTFTLEHDKQMTVGQAAVGEGNGVPLSR